MTIDRNTQANIVAVAGNYINKPFDYEKYNCVHFVREVYRKVGINLPILDRYDYPPKEFHLFDYEFDKMPIGHTVFFRKINNISKRLWSHVAIIYSECELIHCSRYIDGCVTITHKDKVLRLYSLSDSKPP